MAHWWSGSAFDDVFDTTAASALNHLKPKHFPRGSVLFRPDDAPIGFVLLLSGRVHVILNSQTGRELLLYSIEPGQSCLQTTLAILGSQRYSAEAVAMTDLVAVIVPPSVFHDLMDQSPAFRGFVFRAFATRMGDMTALLESVAFVKIEQRLARWLLDHSKDGCVEASHADIATGIATAREVVSRRLERMVADGLVETDRRLVRIVDWVGLRQMAEQDRTQ